MSSSPILLPRVLVPFASGTEEIEFSSIVGTLRRAKIFVEIAAIGKEKTVKGSRGIILTADSLLSELPEFPRFDGILLSGGVEGAKNFAGDEKLMKLLKIQAEEKKFYGAICASPALCLSPHGLIPSNLATCHPSQFSSLKNSSGSQIYSSEAEIREGERVIFDEKNNLLTSVGPGSGIEFALRAVEILLGDSIAQELANSMMIKGEWKSKL